MDAARLPGDVMAGEVDPLSQEGIERAANLGMMAAPMSPAARGTKFVPGSGELKATGGRQLQMARDANVVYSTAYIQQRFFRALVENLAKALDVLLKQCENPKFKEVVKNLRNEVQGGAAFAVALAEHPKVFPDLYCSMVRAGEIGSLLDEVLERLADFTEEEIETRGKIISAMAYPAIMLVVGACVAHEKPTGHDERTPLA